MSVSLLLNEEVKNQAWCKLYANEVHADEVHANHYFGGSPDDGEYEFPASKGTTGQSMVVSSDPAQLIFQDTIVGPIAWGAIISGAGPLFMKISAPTNASPGTSEDNNSRTFIPFACQIVYVSRSIQTINSNQQWNFVVNGSSNIIPLPSTMNAITPINVPANASLSVAFQSGTSPDGSSIYVWLRRTS